MSKLEPLELEITSRLREYATLEKHSRYASEAMREAADEIDRLRDVEQHLLDEIAYLKSAIQEAEHQAGQTIEQAKYDAMADAEREMRHEFRQRGWTRDE